MINCWICLDIGYIAHIQKFRIGGKTIEYETILYCSCSKGNNLKADKLHAEPISKYFSIFKLQQANKRRFGG